MATKAEDLKNKTDPVKAALKQAIQALDRAGHHDYPPHIQACMASCIDHVDSAVKLLARHYRKQ